MVLFLWAQFCECFEWIYVCKSAIHKKYVDLYFENSSQKENFRNKIHRREIKQAYKGYVSNYHSEKWDGQ